MKRVKWVPCSARTEGWLAVENKEGIFQENSPFLRTFESPEIYTRRRFRRFLTSIQVGLFDARFCGNVCNYGMWRVLCKWYIVVDYHVNALFHDRLIVLNNINQRKCMCEYVNIMCGCLRVTV